MAKAQEVETIIAVELISNMINALHDKLSDKSKLINEVKYHSEALNASLAKDFNQIVLVLQKTVDEFYTGYYLVEGFEYICGSEIDYAVNHNLEILKTAKKLVKFAG